VSGERENWLHEKKFGSGSPLAETLTRLWRDADGHETGAEAVGGDPRAQAPGGGSGGEGDSVLLGITAGRS
jgi:hypothetical protein